MELHWNSLLHTQLFITRECHDFDHLGNLARGGGGVSFVNLLTVPLVVSYH